MTSPGNQHCASCIGAFSFRIAVAARVDPPYSPVGVSVLRTMVGGEAGFFCGGVVNGVRRMNEVNARRARLLPGWVTVFGQVYQLCM